MKKKFKILLMTILIIAASFTLFIQTVNAETIVNANDYKPSEIANAGKIAVIGNTIIGGVQFVGSIVSVVALIAIGIKYMVGSVEERAEYKKIMFPYVVGAIMLFSITNLLAIISSIVS